MDLQLTVESTDKTPGSTVYQFLQDALKTTIREQVYALQAHVIARKLTGDVLHQRTGNLIRSLTTEVTQSGDTTVGILGVGREAPYGAVHEMGGTFNVPQSTVREHIRNGYTVREHIRRAHSATYPQRSFLESSRNEREGDIRSAIEDTIAAAVRQ